MQQQDRARQRQGSAPPYSSQPPRQEAWAGVKDNTYIQATPIRTGDNRSSKESVAAAAVAAAEAMASYRNGGKVAAMPRFEGPNKTINRTDSNSSERRSSVEKRASDRPDPKSKPEWIGTSASTDSVGSGRDSIGSSRAPKVYRHGSPAPRTANTARLSQTGGGSSSSLRRDSLGRDSLGSTGGDSLGTARSRDSNNSYRRPSPSPYEQRQSSRPVSAGTARPVSRSSTPTRSEKPVDVTSGGSGSRSSTPTRSWRF